MRIGSLLRASPVAAALLFGACASAGMDPGAESVDRGDPVVIVENHGWEDVRVYALRHGSRMRVGMVTAMNTGRFTLKPGMVDPAGYVQLVLQPIATRQGMVMQRIPLWNGDVVHLDVQNVLAHSSFTVR